MKKAKKCGICFLIIFILIGLLLCQKRKTDVRDHIKENREALLEKEGETEGEEENWEKRPLIQTTTFREEYEGMVHCGGTTMAPAAEPEENVYEQVKPVIVKINAGGYYGSGVIWEMKTEEVIIISNRHLLEGWDDRSYITFENGNRTAGRVLMLSDKKDLGFLAADAESIGYEELIRLRAVEREAGAYENMKAGDPLFIVGSSEGVEKNIYDGTFEAGKWYVEDFDTEMILGFCYGRPGMSGGGTFDERGNFIGMLSGGNGSEIVSVPITDIMEEALGMEEKLADK